MSLSLLHYNIISYLLLLPIIVNLFNWQSTYLSLFFGGVFTIFQILIFGQHIASKRSMPRQIGIGTIVFVLINIVTSGIIYFLFNLSKPGIAFSFLLIPAWGSLFLLKKEPQQKLELFHFSKNHFKLPLKTWGLVIAYFSLIIIAFSQLFNAMTTEAIRSPWDVLPASFWGIYFLATLIALIIYWDKPLPLVSYAISFTHIFISLSISIIIYKIGYGFDPFIHQATEQAIANEGVILPKTPYYIGQYGLVISLHNLLGISLIWLDKLLVALLAAITIPLLWVEFLSSPNLKQHQTSNGSWLAIVFLLIPFGVFITTTPQALANLIFLWIVISAFSLLSDSDSPLSLPILWLMGFAAAITHPLTGIPALIFLAILSYESYKDKLRFPNWLHHFIYLEFVVIGAISISLMFLLNGFISNQFTTRIKDFLSIKWSDVTEWWPINTFLTEPQYRDHFYEFAYFIQENIWWMLTIAIFAVIVWMLSKRRHIFVRVYLLTSLILILNAIIISAFIEFPDLIIYESKDYAARLFHLAFLTLTPFLGIGLLWLNRKRQNINPVFSWTILIFLAWVITGNLFSSYPRNNNYELGRQFSTSASDIKTVNKIGQYHNNYVVLANQSVSAAAIKQFGFKKYYQIENGQQFFYYPVPTSSPLYKIYLDMVYDQPSRSNAKKASALADVNTVYFAINEYWDNSKNIIEKAKLEADEWVQIDEGKVMIFTYRFSE